MNEADYRMNVRSAPRLRAAVPLWAILLGIVVLQAVVVVLGVRFLF